MRAGQKRRPLVGLAIVVVLMTAFASTPVTAGAQSTDRPGVTAKEIKVGALLGLTNPNGVTIDQIGTGAHIYFDQFNKRGGVFGRKIDIVKTVDDQSRASKNIIGARSLVEESKVFAALVGTQVFAGADVFKKAGTPTFGWNIQSEWEGAPNLFGAYGSYGGVVV